MIINKVQIKSFGLLRGYETSFSDSINIIEGANETGKSTLAAFIKYMLYGFPKERPGVLSEREHRINWQTGEASGSMTVTLQNGVKYVIRRQTIRKMQDSIPTYEESCEVVEASTGRALQTQCPGEFFLLADKSFFEATAHLGQLAILEQADKNILTAIENLMFSGSETASAELALNNLKEAQDALLSSDGEHGAIAEVKSRANALAAKLGNAVRQSKELLEERTKENEHLAHRQDAEANLQRFRELKAAHRNYTVMQAFDELHELERKASDLTIQADTYRRDCSFEDFFPDEEYLEDVKKKRQVFMQAKADYEFYVKEVSRLENETVISHDLEKTLQRVDRHGGEETVLAKYKKLNGSFVSRLLWSLLFFLLSAGALVGGVLFLNPPYSYAAFGGAAVSFICFFILFLRMFKKLEAVKSYCLDYSCQNGKELIMRMQLVHDAKLRSSNHIESLRKAREAQETTKNLYLTARSVLEECLSCMGKTLPIDEDLHSFLDLFEGSMRTILNRHVKYVHDLQETNASIDVLRRHLNTISERDVRASLTQELIEALKETTPEKIEEAISYYEEQLRYYNQIYLETKNHVEELRAQAENPSELAEAYTAAENELDVLEHRYAAITTALNGLKGADHRLRAELAPKLAHYSKQMMNIMTDGKYSTLNVGEDLHLHLYVDGAERSVDYLSGGTRDMAYITLRLGLVRLLYKETPPVTLDESFAHQDNDRSYNLFNLLATLSKKDHVQTFIYTCRTREASIAREQGVDALVISLL